MQAKNDLKFLGELAAMGIEYIRLPNLAEGDVSSELEVEIKHWLISPKNIFVLDFESSITITQPILVKLTQFRNSLVKAGKEVYSVNVGSKILDELKLKGLERSFGLCRNMDEVKNRLPQPGASSRQNVDAKILRQFVESASEAFEVQMGVKLSVQKISSKKHIFEESDAVVGIVDIDSSGFRGSIALCFGEKVFFSVYKALLGEDLEHIDEESKDAAGELMNIIYGSAKSALNKNMNQSLKPVIPTVELSPKKIKTTQPVIVVPFSSNLGSFRIEICMR